MYFIYSFLYCNPICQKTQSMQLTFIPVIIIGAGPAGSSASIFLNKDNIAHVILEKATFPRDKICGDACSGKTTEVIRKANPTWLEEIIQQGDHFFPCDGIDFVAPNGKTLNVPFRLTKRKDNEITGFTSPRVVFDNFLFEKAQLGTHATIHQGVKDILIERLPNENIQVTATVNGTTLYFETPVIIAADGDKSKTTKALMGKNLPLKSDCVGIRAYYSNVAALSKDNFIELHFMKEFLPGYFWIFPLPNGKVNVGAGMLTQYVKDHKINLRERMLEAMDKNPVLKERFRDAKLESKISGWALPMATTQLSISGDHYILTGDAANLIDPFSGEGIGNAMYSGMLAAWAVKKAMDSKDYSAAFFKEAYDDAVYRYFGDEFKISTMMQKLCNYPFLFNLVVNKSQKSESLRNTISGMFSDIQVRAQLKKPSFYLKVLMNK